MSSGELFNLMWAYPAPGREIDRGQVGRQHSSDSSTATLNTPAIGIEAIILFPALTTPTMVAGTSDLEILLLAHEDSEALQVWHVNRQLKFSSGLDPTKSFATEPLYSPPTSNDIRIESGSLSTTVETESQFKGVLDARSLSFYRNKNFTRLYKLTLRNPASFLRRTHVPDGALNSIQSGRMRPGEKQDAFLWQVCRRLNGRSIERRGLYRLRTNSRGVDMTRSDPNDPLQSYHPLVYYESLDYADIGFLSDIHVSTRQDILALTGARVIEYEEGSEEADTGNSPELGPVVNIAAQNMRQIMHRMGRRNTEIVALGGDLIDYLKNAYIPDSGSMTVKEIWDHVELGSNYETNYQNFIDMLAIYSIIVEFYRDFSKPVFAITGNHDSYPEAYGISPRVTLGPIEKRANEGIPADHNLTLYEAILIFGRTYGETMGSFSPRTGMMRADLFEWFYMALTPFKDYTLSLPKQQLIGLGWGDTEDMFDSPGTDHGFGHLPRSDQAITDNQLAIVNHGLEKAEERSANTILLSHFTFVSYAEHIAMSGNPEGDVEFDWSADHSDYDMGTFEENRKVLYEDYMAVGRKIQLAIAGHSHRRGLHLLTRADYSGDNSVKTRLYDYHQLRTAYRRHPDAKRPVVIVSDAAGSIPRYNGDGEFEGWGSDRAAGTEVNFDSSGDINRVRVVRSNRKPRIAVPVDYFDLLEERVFRSFGSQAFGLSQGSVPTDGYQFSIRLHDHLRSRSIRIAAVTLYCKRSRSWVKAEFSEKQSRTEGVQVFVVSGTDAANFLRQISVSRSRGTFLSVQLAAPRSRVAGIQYDCESHWNFEVQIREERRGSRVVRMRGDAFTIPEEKLFLISRNATRAEIPDFSWREQLQKYQ